MVLPDDDGVTGAIRDSAPQDGTDPGLELLGRVGLDHIVVGTGIQGTDHRGVVVSRAHHDDRDLPDGPQHREHRMPIDVGQAEVEQNHVRLALDSDPQPL